MEIHVSERHRYLDAWYKFVTAVEADDCATVKHMRGQFPDQQLGTALVDAARFNSVMVVAELLHNPSDGILLYVHDALMKSAENGCAEVLNIVLQHTNPVRTACYNLALWGALVHNHPECVEMLFDWIEVDDVLRIAHERGAKPNAAFGVFEHRISARQNAILTHQVEHTGTHRIRKI